MSQKTPSTRRTLQRTNEQLEANHSLNIGSTGSGKTSLIKAQVMEAARLLIWDPEGTYKVPKVRSIDALRRHLQKVGFGPVRVALECEPTQDNFEAFCDLAFRVGHQAAPMDVVVEELADVSRVGKASPLWGQLLRKGRKYGITLWIASQRPQEIDKTTLGQCRHINCGLLTTKNDRRYMADNLDIDQGQIEALQKLQFWRRSLPEKAARINVKFVRGKPYIVTKVT